MAKTILLIIISSTAFVTSSLAQKQLVFITKGHVVARYQEGGEFKFKMKNGQKKDGFIVELFDFSMITSKDTIQFSSIRKVGGHRQAGIKLNQGVGGLLFLGGLGYVGIDRLNYALGYNKGNWDQSDNTGLIIGGVGAAMLFIKPKYQRLKLGTSIRTLDYKSPFYQMP